MRLRVLAWAAGLGVLLLGGAAVATVVADARADAALLRADPDVAGSDPALVRRAAAVAHAAFARRCAGCHGTDMRGDRRMGAPDLADGDWLYGSGRVAEIEQTILYGVRSGAARAHAQAVMPAFGAPPRPGPGQPGALTPAQVEDVARYVVRLQGGAVDGDAAARGRAVFEGAGGCYDCHGRTGGGDPAIGAPNLTDRVHLTGDGSLESIRAVLLRGHAGVCPAWSGRLSPAVIRALAVTIARAARPDSHGGPA